MPLVLCIIHSKGGKALKSVYFRAKTSALISDVRDTPLIEPPSGMCLICLIPGSDRISSLRCQGQIACRQT